LELELPRTPTAAALRQHDRSSRPSLSEPVAAHPPSGSTARSAQTSARRNATKLAKRGPAADQHERQVSSAAESRAARALPSSTSASRASPPVGSRRQTKALDASPPWRSTGDAPAAPMQASRTPSHASPAPCAVGVALAPDRRRPCRRRRRCRRGRRRRPLAPGPRARGTRRRRPQHAVQQSRYRRRRRAGHGYAGIAARVRRSAFAWLASALVGAVVAGDSHYAVAIAGPVLRCAGEQRAGVASVAEARRRPDRSARGSRRSAIVVGREASRRQPVAVEVAADADDDVLEVLLRARRPRPVKRDGERADLERPRATRRTAGGGHRTTRPAGRPVRGEDGADRGSRRCANSVNTSGPPVATPVGTDRLSARGATFVPLTVEGSHSENDELLLPSPTRRHGSKVPTTIGNLGSAVGHREIGDREDVECVRMARWSAGAKRETSQSVGSRGKGFRA
jgi:hypothetical protein